MQSHCKRVEGHLEERPGEADEYCKKMRRFYGTCKGCSCSAKEIKSTLKDRKSGKASGPLTVFVEVMKAGGFAQHSKTGAPFQDRVHLNQNSKSHCLETCFF